MARSFLVEAGFAGEPLDIMLATCWWECVDPFPSTCLCHPELPARPYLHFWDAVGDWKVVDPSQPEYNPEAAAKWRTSMNMTQTRALVDPEAWGGDAYVRIAERLRTVVDGVDQAVPSIRWAAYSGWVISRSGTYFTPWSVFKSGGHLRSQSWDASKPVGERGQDFELHQGHRYREKWILGATD